MRVPEPQPPSGTSTPGPASSANSSLDATRTETLLTVLQVATLLAMAGSVATRLWQDHLWYGFVLVGVTVLVWTPEFRLRRVRIWWFTYVAGIFVYTLLRALADETVVPIQTHYVIWLDDRLPGMSPVRWLQNSRLDNNFPNFLDWAAIAVHWSFFIAPHAAAVAIFLFRRALFPAYAALLVLIMWVGLGLFFLLPTVPPWLAGQQGELEGVTRVMDATIRESLGDDNPAFPGGASTYDDFYAALGEPNSVAAMPSIHMAVTFAMYLWARRYAPKFAGPLLAYSVLMAVALAYLGEHYIADELAGVLVAVGAWAVIKRTRWAPPPQAARW
jgi:hypothetical protein